MKRLFIVVMIAAMVCVSTGMAMAATVTTNVNVSANIVGTCKVDTTPTFAFGNLDLTLAADAELIDNLVFWCTNGTPYTLGDEANPGVADGSFSGTLLSGTDSLPYTIAYTNFSGAGTGKTTPKTSVLTVTIANADYVNAVPGVYTDTVTFTITY